MVIAEQRCLVDEDLEKMECFNKVQFKLQNTCNQYYVHQQDNLMINEFHSLKLVLKIREL